jgi:hypothetical protein
MQIICAWAGPAFIAILLPAWLNMGFLPPLQPTLTPQEVADVYEEHRNWIRLGATLTMQFTMFGVAWTAAIAAQMRRIETGPTPVLTYTQLACGTIGFMLFVFPSVIWSVAAFRPERDIELIYLLNDYAWLALVMPVMSATIQAFAIGLVILSDKRSKPIFPRWSAYFNFWCGIVFLPGALATFFKTGPFAWNGLFDFNLPLTVFTLWIIVMAWLVASAAKRQAREEASGV